MPYLTLKGTSKNSPFVIWPDLLLQLCAAEIPQYTKYSGISATEFGTKSLAQIIKKEFLEVAYNLNRSCGRGALRMPRVRRSSWRIVSGHCPPNYRAPLKTPLLALERIWRPINALWKSNSMQSILLFPQLFCLPSTSAPRREKRGFWGFRQFVLACNCCKKEQIDTESNKMLFFY